MCSIISFGSVRMSGMGRNLVTPYAAFGVGLAIVLTFGLTAISSVVEQPSQNQFMASQPEAIQMVPAVPSPEVPSQPSEMQEDVGARAGAPSGEMAGEAVMEKVPVKQETTESYSIAAEVPSPNPFAGLLMVIPYIAAAAVGSVVFVLTRNRVGW
jgi:hypothetical protein